MKIQSIYIIHYKQNTDRKKYLDQQLKSVKIPFYYRSQYDRDSLEILEDKYFEISNENREKRNKVMLQYNKQVEIGPPKDTLKGRAYRAVTLEHFKTYEHILQNTNDEWSLILEDDVIFNMPLQSIIEFYEKRIPDNCDVCYLGSGCKLAIPFNDQEDIVENHQKHSRCSDSYVIKRPALHKIVETALPFYTVIDWELNYLQMLNKLTVFWATKPQIYQGSQAGLYESCFHIFEK